MKALFLSCTLKEPPEPSNTEALCQVLIDQLTKEGVESELVRLSGLNIKPGVKSDQGEGDEWPGIREKILAADILVMATPTWLGQHSSICQRALVSACGATKASPQSSSAPFNWNKVRITPVSRSSLVGFIAVLPVFRFN